MRRTKLEYELELDIDACYKMESIYNESKENFESVEKWLYLGADLRDGGYAKLGLTMGDLSSRSYSSANPYYYIFCAFKCHCEMDGRKLASIERDALRYLDGVFVNPDGSTKRVPHTESGRMSECFYNIDFVEFFVVLHEYLYGNYRNCFLPCGFENEAGYYEGEFLDCEFNKRMSLFEINECIRKILQF
ncbi:hypothetical protein BJP27_22895 [Pseudomonas oryzihabitans]|nr:hypothetical protein BJP27_22895 [Pseudomonas psychrotolerans]